MDGEGFTGRRDGMGTHYRGRAAEVRALDTYIKLTRASSSVGVRLSRGLAEAGLTPHQLGVLEALRHLGPLGQRVLGGKLLTTGRLNASAMPATFIHCVMPPTRSRSIITMSIERASSMWRKGTMP